MSAIALSIRGLRKSFARGLARCAHRTIAISDVDLDLYCSEIVGLTGTEGAGKTTLLQCVSGLLRPDGGSVTVRNDRRHRPLSLAVAYVPAIPIYYPFLTVRDVIALRASRLAQRGGAVDETLSLLDLHHIQGDIIATLSPCELARLAIAEAAVTRPVAVMVDTTASTSALARVPVQRALEKVASTGAAIMIASRDERLVGSVTTRVVHLSEASVVAMPAPLFVAERLH
jgi:ABC-2 type transport system ATP-binding protein